MIETNFKLRPEAIEQQIMAIASNLPEFTYIVSREGNGRRPGVVMPVTRYLAGVYIKDGTHRHITPEEEQAYLAELEKRTVQTFADNEAAGAVKMRHVKQELTLSPETAGALVDAIRVADKSTKKEKTTNVN
jgi:hypothetical protein